MVCFGNWFVICFCLGFSVCELRRFRGCFVCFDCDYLFWFAYVALFVLMFDLSWFMFVLLTLGFVVFGYFWLRVVGWYVV